MQLNNSITIERKRVECNSLPRGWQREEVLRKSGISAGKVDVYYYSPTGKKIESKPQLARHLGDAIDISSFDFQTGKIIQHLALPSISLYRCNSGASTTPSSGSVGIGGSASGGTAAAAVVVVGASNASSPNPSASSTATSNALKRKYKSQTVAGVNSNVGSSYGITNTTNSANLRQHLEFSRALRTDVSLVPPIRQTASIFKQPVTVIRNHENGKVKHDPKHGAQEKPKQLFWEKRLERLRACHSTGEEFDDIVLPKGLRSVGPNVNEQTVLQSLATALHVLNTPVMGQTSTKTEFNKNATAFINPEQPLMQSVIISEEDLRRQEDRVNVARRKLQDALKA